MSLTLMILRHAKSGWDDPLLADHDRGLTDRGVENATALGRWMRGKGIVPDLIVSSDATRTRQTVAHLLTGLEQQAQVQFDAALYNASAATLLRRITQTTGATNVLICAHNPGIGDLAQMLVTAAPDHPRFDDYPTAALTVIRLDADGWSGIRQGHCTDFVIPADI